MTSMLWVGLFFVCCMTLVYLNIQKLAAASPNKAPSIKPKSPQLERSSQYAERLYGDKRYLAAEKAFLEVIKLDHKNVTAYNRLGRIYLELKNYPDAIECCQIVSQLDPSPSAYFNLGTVLYENKNYSKALVAFEKAISLKPSAHRYIGLAKTYQRLSNLQKAIDAYEKAVELDASTANQQALLSAYRAGHETERAQALMQRLNQKIAPK